MKSRKTRNAMFAAATSAIAMPTRLTRFLLSPGGRSPDETTPFGSCGTGSSAIQILREKF
jgi:hypothetical protein